MSRKSTVCDHCVRAAVAERERAVVGLRAAGMKNAEVARALGMTHVAVRSLIYRMRRDGTEIPVSPHYLVGRQ